MGKLPWISDFAQALRVVMITALILVVPLTEGSHAMPVGTAMSMTQHDMADAHAMHMSGKMPASNGGDSASCQILCLGWVQTADITRPEVPFLALTLLEPLAHLDIPEGLPPAPIGHPPKSALVL